MLIFKTWKWTDHLLKKLEIEDMDRSSHSMFCDCWMTDLPGNVECIFEFPQVSPKSTMDKESPSHVESIWFRKDWQ